jgi:cob(I)alamin adenosyltransferase
VKIVGVLDSGAFATGMLGQLGSVPGADSGLVPDLSDVLEDTRLVLYLSETTHLPVRGLVDVAMEAEGERVEMRMDFALKGYGKARADTPARPDPILAGVRRRDEPVRLTRIYTRAGDTGETSLGDGSRVRKTDPRIEAYGTVDELNAVIGVALARGLPEELRPWLEEIQNELFDLGADLSVPLEDERERLRVTEAQVERLEGLCDRVNERLEPLRSFVLPGGSEAAALLHVARTVCRRAERRAAALAETSELNPAALAYLNRLSDLFFILARAANAEGGSPEPLWKPGSSS